mgnify:CR=1 FL=1
MLLFEASSAAANGFTKPTNDDRLGLFFVVFRSSSAFFFCCCFALAAAAAFFFLANLKLFNLEREDLVFAFKVKKKLFVKLEEANFKKTKRRILKFLKVNYHKNFEIATFLRKSWSGDKLSNFKDDKKGKFNEEVKNKDWNLFFSKKDKQVLNFIYYDYRVFGYNFNKIYFNSFLYFMIFSLMPLSFEKKLFSVDYLFNQHKYKKYKFLNLYFYLKRILYFYYVLFDTMFSHINRKK